MKTFFPVLQIAGRRIYSIQYYRLHRRSGTKESGLRLLSDQSQYFTSGLSGNRWEGLREYALQRLFLWRNDIYFGQRRDKQTARETIICRLAAGNFEDETASVQNIIYRMTAEKFEYETNSTQMRFVE